MFKKKKNPKVTTIKGKKWHTKLHKNIKFYTSKNHTLKNRNKIKQSAKDGFCNIYGKEYYL